MVQSEGDCILWVHPLSCAHVAPSAMQSIWCSLTVITLCRCVTSVLITLREGFLVAKANYVLFWIYDYP